jgi:hypothetical protein
MWKAPLCHILAKPVAARPWECSYFRPHFHFQDLACDQEVDLGISVLGQPAPRLTLHSHI